MLLPFVSRPSQTWWQQIAPNWWEWESESWLYVTLHLKVRRWSNSKCRVCFVVFFFKRCRVQHPLTTVDKCGWYLWVRGSGALQFLCWITPASVLSPQRRGSRVGGRPRRAGGARSAPVACCTPAEPPAPPAPAHQACPLESRATTTQMLSVYLLQHACLWVYVRRVHKHSHGLLLSAGLIMHYESNSLLGSEQFALHNCKSCYWLRQSWIQNTMNPTAWVCKCLEFYHSTDSAFWPEQ